jgi:hypothetical protein
MIIGLIDEKSNCYWRLIEPVYLPIWEIDGMGVIEGINLTGHIICATLPVVGMVV